LCLHLDITLETSRAGFTFSLEEGDFFASAKTSCEKDRILWRPVAVWGAKAAYNTIFLDYLKCFDRL